MQMASSSWLMPFVFYIRLMSLGLKNKIGLLGGVGIVVGGVIGMGTYVLIPGIAANAGPAAWLAITIAIVVSLLSVLPLIQLSSAMPIAGGGFEYCRRLLSPYAGYLVSWLAVIGGACSISLISMGLSEQFKEYLPTFLPPHIAAMVFVALFYLFYLLGLQIVTMVQVVLCLQLLIALFMYFLPIIFSKNFVVHATLPETSNFVLALILAFNICIGFQIIIELGEEMENPSRNIPMALMIGGGLILFVYLSVTFAYIYSVGLEHTGEKIKLITTALPYYGVVGIAFIKFGVISSGLASYSGGAIALPRELYAMARAKALPAYFYQTDAKGNPSRAVGLFFGIVLLIMGIGNILEYNGFIDTYFGPDVIEFYGFLAIFGIMIMTIVLSIAALRLPTLMPQAYASAYIRLPKWMLYSLCVLSVLSSLFLIVVIMTKMIVLWIYLVALALITALYFTYSKKRIVELDVSSEIE
jgi:APA family basic amino acid/polyamine antiporter